MSQTKELTPEDIFWYQIEEMALDVACAIMQNPTSLDAGESINTEKLAATSVQVALSVRGQVIEARKQGELRKRFETPTEENNAPV